MTDLIILGVGPHSQEMVEIIERVNRAEPTWNLVGFLGTDSASVGNKLNGCPVLGTQADWARFADACFVPDCSAASRALDIPRDRLATLVDPSAFVSRTATLGAGCVVYPHGFVGNSAQIGDYLFCLSHCTISHDDVVGDRVTMASGARLAGYVHVEDDCYLGQACTCKPGLAIGRGSLLGMGAVVVKRVEPNSVMVGNPARKLRDNA